MIPATPSAHSKIGEQSHPTYNAELERIVAHTNDTRSFFLRLPAYQCLVFKPGQFLSFALPIARQVLTRPYSIASDPENGALVEICFNLVPGGVGSRYLWARGIGDVLRFTGPWGTFVYDHSPQSECVFIAEGVGIAPLRPMMKRALRSEARMPIRLLYGAASEDALLYRAEFQAWEKRYAHFHFDALLHDSSVEQGRSNTSLLEMVKQQYIFSDDDRSRHFYICGVGALVTTIRDLLRQAGYQRRAVQYEKW